MDTSALLTANKEGLEKLFSRMGEFEVRLQKATGAPAPLHSDLKTLATADNAEPALKRLKQYLQQNFNCSLKDEHLTMLHYHINETMRYSELFSLLEQLKRQFPRLVEDYSVTETTLEEVFLSFAQPHPHPPAEPHPSNNQPV